MSLVMRWNSSGSRELAIAGSGKWIETRERLRLTMVGYLLMAFAGLLGVALLSAAGEWLASRLSVSVDETMLVVYAFAGITLLSGYFMTLVGLFRSLQVAPQGNGARELLFAALLCNITMAFALVSGHTLGGKENYALLARGVSGFAAISVDQIGTLLQLLGLVLGLAGILLFSGFLYCLADYLRYPTRAISGFFWYIAFLIGGTFGVFLNTKHITNPDVWHALALAWCLGLVWNLALAFGTLRSLNRRLSLHPTQEPNAKPSIHSALGIALRDGSFFPHTSNSSDRKEP